MAGTRYAVKCDKHGMLDSKRGWKTYNMPVPKSKKQRFLMGCPVCRKEVAVV